VVLTLVLVLIVAPLIELAVFIQVTQWIGLLNALAFLLLVSLGGVLIVRHQGLGVIRRVRDQVRAGNLPAADLVDGLLILIAGVLLILPGFVSDFVGLILLLPPTRTFVRRRIQKRYSVRIAARVVNTVRPPRRVANETDVVVLPPAALPPPGPVSPPPPRDRQIPPTPPIRDQ
jgi:UPF0716 protein FxsA